MAAWISSTDIFHHNLPHIPLIHLSTVNSSPHPGIAPLSLNSSSQPLHLPGDLLTPVRGKYGCGKDCLILIPFRLPQISCCILSLKCFSSDSDNCPDVGIGPLLQFPHPPRAGPVLLTLVFPPISFLLPSFAWIYIFFSTGQVLLSAPSWCSAGTSVSEGVFLMYPWREMYSMSTYSSIIFPLQCSCLENPRGQRSMTGYSPWDSPGKNTRVERTRWQRSRWTWSTSLSKDTPGIHLQTEMCMQNTSCEWTGVPDQQKRIYRTMQNSVG